MVTKLSTNKCINCLFQHHRDQTNSSLLFSRVNDEDDHLSGLKLGVAPTLPLLTTVMSAACHKKHWVHFVQKFPPWWCRRFRVSVSLVVVARWHLSTDRSSPGFRRWLVHQWCQRQRLHGYLQQRGRQWETQLGYMIQEQVVYLCMCVYVNRRRDRRCKETLFCQRRSACLPLRTKPLSVFVLFPRVSASNIGIFGIREIPHSLRECVEQDWCLQTHWMFHSKGQSICEQAFFKLKQTNKQIPNTYKSSTLVLKP